MTVSTKLKFDGRFRKTLLAKYEQYTFQAGVLRDKTYYAPRPRKAGLEQFEGGPVRKQSPKAQGTVSDVAERIRKDLHVDYVRGPLRTPESRAMRAFSKALGDLLTGKVKSPKAAEAALQNVLRVPIKKLRYGVNKLSTERAKGFNRFLFDTSQFFRAVIAKAVKGRKNV